MALPSQREGKPCVHSSCTHVEKHGNMKRHLKNQHSDPPPKMRKADAMRQPEHPLVTDRSDKEEHALLSVKRREFNGNTMEHLDRLSDVLNVCQFDVAVLKDWATPEQLNAIPNSRLRKQPGPRRYHTPFEIILDSALRRMPTLDKVMMDLFHSLLENSCPNAEVWEGNEQLEFSNEEWKEWTESVIEDDDDRPILQRVLNMVMTDLISESDIKNYHTQVAKVAANLIPMATTQTIQGDANANITPRGTYTEVHHDSEHSISTAIGFTNDPDQALKLWLLWPSTELKHLPQCVSSTQKALKKMDHCQFLVQMSGETIFVPPNSPHAVFTLASCYLYGHGFATSGNRPWAFDPPTLLTTMEGTTAEEEKAACDKRLVQLRAGLEGAVVGKFDPRLASGQQSEDLQEEIRQAHVDQFFETWAGERQIFRKYPDKLTRLVKVWAADIKRRRLCVWCPLLALEAE